MTVYFSIKLALVPENTRGYGLNAIDRETHRRTVDKQDDNSTLCKKQKRHEEQDFNVEDLTTNRTVKPQRQWKVKLEGFDEETWGPEGNVKHLLGNITECS